MESGCADGGVFAFEVADSVRQCRGWEARENFGPKPRVKLHGKNSGFVHVHLESSRTTGALLTSSESHLGANTRSGTDVEGAGERARPSRTLALKQDLFEVER